MLPFDFVVPQRPVSAQARRRERLREWMAVVAEHARKPLPDPWSAAVSPVSVRILYLCDEDVLDVDNILKPILDALIGIAYEDDALVTDVEIRRRSLRTTFTATSLSPALGAALALGRECAYVALDHSPDQTVLP